MLANSIIDERVSSCISDTELEVVIAVSVGASDRVGVFHQACVDLDLLYS